MLDAPRELDDIARLPLLDDPPNALLPPLRLGDTSRLPARLPLLKLLAPAPDPPRLALWAWRDWA
jgi:hypothetical protein